jgi:hypothetical protein
MLSSTVHRPLRSVTLQLSLPFRENPPLKPAIWEQLDEQQRAVVLDQLAHLIAKTAENDTKPEDRRHA